MAVAYVESKAGPQFKTLSENEMRMLERMATSNRLQAFVFYIQARLPENLAARLLELGSAGDDLGIQQFAADERISEIAKEAVAFCFYWNNPRANEEFFNWARANDDGRMWTFALLDSLWNRYNVAASVDRLAQEPQPTPEELEQLSDTEIESLLAESRRLRAKQI